MGPIRISVPGNPRYVATLRLLVGVLARQAGCDEEGVADLKLAVSELATASVEAGSEVVEMTAHVDDGELVVRLPAAPSHADQLVDPIGIAKALVDGCAVDPVKGEVALTVLAVAGRRDLSADPMVVSFESSVAVPALARAAVSQLIDGVPPARRTDVLLLVSELVSNSVIHGRPLETGTSTLR